MLEARLERLLTSKGEALSTHLRLRHDKATVLRNTKHLNDETERLESMYAALLPILSGLNSVVYDTAFTSETAPAALLALFHGSNVDTNGQSRRHYDFFGNNTLQIDRENPMQMVDVSLETLLKLEKLSPTSFDSNNLQNTTLEDTRHVMIPSEQMSTLSMEETNESKLQSGTQLAHTIIEAARERDRLEAAFKSARVLATSHTSGASLSFFTWQPTATSACWQIADTTKAKVVSVAVIVAKRQC